MFKSVCYAATKLTKTNEIPLLYIAGTKSATAGITPNLSNRDYFPEAKTNSRLTKKDCEP